MQTKLTHATKSRPEIIEAESILRSCTHCGFCNATCPTYQLLGDELDGPRGRIYQIKKMLEGETPTRATQGHLDRCLTCRACETTCPSGVEYAKLVDIGRMVVEDCVSRPWHERMLHWLLRESLTHRWMFGSALRLARTIAFVLPAGLRTKVGKARPAGVWPVHRHKRRVAMLNGCVQPAMLPSIDAATARVLDAVGVESVIVEDSGCCGALRHHLHDQAGALDDVRRNVHAWWSRLDSGDIEAIVINSSACCAMIQDYVHLLRHDTEYADKARRVSEASQDVGRFLASELASGRIRRLPAARIRIALQVPCTLQHGLGIRGETETLLTSLGAKLVPVADQHICCGSAGTYSLLQPALSQRLRKQKLESLERHKPDIILSANMGCISHLEAGASVPVRHWIEWVDELLAQTAENRQ